MEAVRSRKEGVVIGFFWVVVISVTMMTGFKLLAEDKTEPVAAARPDESAAMEQRLAELEAKVKENPGDISALIALGDGYIQIGDAHKAFAVFQKAEKVAPENAHVQSDLGSLYQQMGRYDVALEKYQRAFKLDPARVGLLLHIAMIHRAQGNLDQAREALETLLAKNPEPQYAENARRMLAGIEAETKGKAK